MESPMNNVVNTNGFRHLIQTLSMLMMIFFQIYDADIKDTFTLLKQIALSLLILRIFGILCASSKKLVKSFMVGLVPIFIHKLHATITHF